MESCQIFMWAKSFPLLENQSCQIFDVGKIIPSFGKFVTTRLDNIIPPQLHVYVPCFRFTPSGAKLTVRALLRFTSSFWNSSAMASCGSIGCAHINSQRPILCWQHHQHQLHKMTPRWLSSPTVIRHTIGSFFK
jgi:hypothetical protein